LTVAEKRQATRRKVLKGAVLAFNGHHCTLDCTVRDMSDTGCRLLMSDTLRVPATFDLLIEVDATMVPCEVVRRTAREIGVHFTGPATAIAARREQVITDKTTAKPTLRRKPITA
jgi:PilZ domain